VKHPARQASWILAVRLSVPATAPLRRTCVSRTTRSSGRSQGLVDHCGNRSVRQITPPAPGPLHDGVQLLVGERPESLIDALQACPRREEDREDLQGELLLLTLGEGQNLLRQGLDLCSVHAGVVSSVVNRKYSTVVLRPFLSRIRYRPRQPHRRLC